MYSFCCIPQHLESFEKSSFIRIVNTGYDIPAKTLILVERQRADYYFVYVTAGKMYYEREGQKYVLKQGDIFLCFPGDKQRIVAYPQDKTTLYRTRIPFSYVLYPVKEHRPNRTFVTKRPNHNAGTVFLTLV